jgi:hypothetical protein
VRYTCSYAGERVQQPPVSGLVIEDRVLLSQLPVDLGPLLGEQLAGWGVG